jgi:hypothetical protein
VEPTSPYLYVFVRTDLAPNLRAVQVAHACLNAGAQFGAPDGHNVVLCRVDDEPSLLKEVQRAEAAGIPMSLFHEPDNDVGYSAACSAPVMGGQRAAFRHCQLLRK